MRFRLFVIFILAVFVAGIFFAEPALAWEKGHMKVVPAAKYEQRWDSNIFYDTDDPKSDHMSIITPSILGEFGFGAAGKHKARVAYNVECGIFYEHTDQNYANHDVFGELFLDVNENYNIRANNTFLFTSDRAGTEFTQRILRKEDTFNAVLEMEFNKLAFDVGYSFYIIDYLSDTLDQVDRYENSGWVTGYVQVAPKTRVLAEYKYKNIKYTDDSPRDANAHYALLGVTGQIAPKVTGTAKVGFEYKKYDNSSPTDFTNAVAMIDLDWTPTERTNVHFGYEREAFESVFRDNNYYAGDHFKLNFKHKLPRNFAVIVNGMYFLNQYPKEREGDNDKRTDNIWAVGPRLEYYWKEYLVAGVGYRFKQRDSNVADRSYDDHIVYGDVKLAF